MHRSIDITKVPMELPNLTGLTLESLKPYKPRQALIPTAPTGVYCLHKVEGIVPCDARVILIRNAVPATQDEFVLAAEFMQSQVRQDVDFMQRPLARKQCTFGPTQYKKYQLFPDQAQWPSLVRRVLEATKQIARLLDMPNPEEYTGVHANYYPDGNASVYRHSDKEKQLVPGAPIFSYTYIANNDPTLARDFTIWKTQDKVLAKEIEGDRQRLVDITLFSGDLLIMDGNMQDYFEHSIEKVGEGQPVAPRLNFTVRKFNPPAPKRSAKRKMPETPTLAREEGGPSSSATEEFPSELP